MPGGKGVGEGMGPIGNCVCIKCGYSIPKEAGVPCMDKKCPKCGSIFLRKGGPHYKKAMKNRK